MPKQRKKKKKGTGPPQRAIRFIAAIQATQPLVTFIRNKVPHRDDWDFMERRYEEMGAEADTFRKGRVIASVIDQISLLESVITDYYLVLPPDSYIGVSLWPQENAKPYLCLCAFYFPTPAHNTNTSENSTETEENKTEENNTEEEENNDAEGTKDKDNEDKNNDKDDDDDDEDMAMKVRATVRGSVKSFLQKKKNQANSVTPPVPPNNTIDFTFRVVILNLKKKMNTLPTALLTLLSSSQNIKTGVNIASQLNVLTRVFPDLTLTFDGLLELSDVYKNTDLLSLTKNQLGLTIKKLDDSEAQSINRPQIEYLTYMAWASLQLGNIYRTNVEIEGSTYYDQNDSSETNNVQQQQEQRGTNEERESPAEKEVANSSSSTDPPPAGNEAPTLSSSTIDTV